MVIRMSSKFLKDFDHGYELLSMLRRYWQWFRIRNLYFFFFV